MARSITWYHPQYIDDATTPELVIEFANDSVYAPTLVEGLGAPEIDVITQGLPLQNGAQYSRANYQPRIVTIEGVIPKKSIHDQNDYRAALSHALALNNYAIKEEWQRDFTFLSESNSGINTETEWLNFLFNTGQLGVLKYSNTGIDVVKRLNCIPISGPTFRNKDGRDAFVSFQIQFAAPFPFWEDDAYTTLVNETNTESKVVDVEILGDVPPRMIMEITGRSATPCMSLAVTAKAKQAITPGQAGVKYLPTMIDIASTVPMKTSDVLWQSFIRGEIQGYKKIASDVGIILVGSATPYIATSTNGTDYIDATTVIGTSWKSVCQSAKLGLFVAVGDASPYIATSTNGKDYVAATTVVGTSWKSVCYSGQLNLFVAVGSATPYIATSTDGKTWIAATTVVGTDWKSVCYSKDKGLFSAIGTASPFFSYSLDGKNWTAGSGAPGFSLGGYGGYAICYSSQKSIFCAILQVGTDSSFIYSYDGKSWEEGPNVASGLLYSVCFSSALGLFVACGNSQYILISTDGKTFDAAGPIGTSWQGSFAFPDESVDAPDANTQLTRFKALECPPGDYQFTLQSESVLDWKVIYRKAYLGV